MIDFNVTHYVYVKLTDKGKEELRRQHHELYITYGKFKEFAPPVEDEDGWSKWQMHVLMNTFGHMMINGFDVPFETSIRIEA